MLRRLRILAHWLRGRRNGVAPVDLLRFLAAPTRARMARRYIATTRTEGEWLVVRLKAGGDELYYPASLAVEALHESICDILNPEHWHCYEREAVRVQPGDVVADCGAAEGLFALTVAPRCSHVYAFEPLPAFVESLRLTLRSVSNASVVPVALGKCAGTARLSNAGTNSALSAEGELAVPMIALDDWFVRAGRRLDFIKADLEGAEMEMLQGAAESIRAFAPRIAITTYHRAGDAEAIAAFLRALRPDYCIATRGIFEADGRPILLQAWGE